MRIRRKTKFECLSLVHVGLKYKCLLSLGDPDHVDADPDADPYSDFYFDADLDSDFYFNADPDSEFFNANPYPTFPPHADLIRILASK
jgi:hypothetical protein